MSLMQKQGKKMKPKSKEETVIEDQDDLDNEDDLDEMENDVFWSLTVDPNDSDCIIEEPTIPGYLVHITSASFGDQVNKNSRTILYCLSLGQKEPTPICVLTEATHESQSLDLMFAASAKFSLKGRNVSTVYLTGYLQPPQPEDLLNDDEDLDDEFDLPRKRGFQDEDEEVEFEEESQPKPKKKGKQQKQEPPTKKPKFETSHEEKQAEKTSEIDKKETQNEDKSKTNDTTTQKPTEAATKTDAPLSKRQQKKAKKAQKQAQQQEQQQNKEVTEKNDSSNANDSTPNKPTTETVKPDVKPTETPKPTDTTEVTHKDLKVGPGPVIKQGQTLLVHYVGQTQDDEIFDKQITGDGFEFKYGSDEVIKGWTLGLKGMKVGGKRRIIIPPQFAYGEKGAGKIPPNATLKFTIEIKSAK